MSHWDFERSSAHRQALLEVMSALVPDGTVQFNRWVMRVEHVEGQTRVCFGVFGRGGLCDG